MNKKSILVKQIQQISGIESVELIMIEPCTPDHMLIHVYLDPESVVDRLSTEEVALRNYQATEKRGQINENTSFWDFTNKLDEEINELKLSSGYLIDGINETKTFDPKELADISLVCDAMAIYYGIDLQAEKESKMKYNEVRK